MQGYKPLLDLFTRHLDDYSAKLNAARPTQLYQPGAYILTLGGKRVRPLLALIAADLLSGNPKKALPSAMAVELFHNFSLIHDDILDNAPKRRNKATVHTKWSTNIAILSGDILLVKAMQALNMHTPSVEKKLSEIFLRTAAEVCEGQQMDMDFEKSKQVTVNDYIHMITLKTAVLLACSLQMGAISVNASKSAQQDLYLFGKHLGIAFQLLDDYLDVYAEKKQGFGKQSGGDILANKKTFLLLRAFELADPSTKKELQAALHMTDNPKGKIKLVKAIYSKLGVDKLCLAEADSHTQVALAGLNRIKTSPAKKEQLKQFAAQLLARKT